MSLEAAAGPLPTVSVVIPTAGGRAPLVHGALSRLLEDPATSEVIVVFDGRDAATEAIVARHAQRDERVRSTHVPPHDGGAREQVARDLGVRLATSEIVLSLDDDVEPEPGLVTGHARRHAAIDGLVLLGYMPVVPPRGRRGARQAVARMYSENYERACSRLAADPDAVLLGLWGGNLSVPRSGWLAAAEQPATSARYHVDRDFGLRLHAVGLTGVFDRELRARHWSHRSVWGLGEAARSSGRGRSALYAAYPELRGLDAAPPPRRAVRPLIRAARSNAGWVAIRIALSGVAIVAAAVKLRPMEDASVRALARVAVARGLYEGGGEGI